jgi:hypothetical protein
MVMGRGGRRFPMGDPHLPWDGYRNIQKWLRSYFPLVAQEAMEEKTWFHFHNLQSPCVYRELRGSPLCTLLCWTYSLLASDPKLHHLGVPHHLLLWTPVWQALLSTWEELLEASPKQLPFPAEPSGRWQASPSTRLSECSLVWNNSFCVTPERAEGWNILLLCG